MNRRLTLAWGLTAPWVAQTTTAQAASGAAGATTTAGDIVLAQTALLNGPLGGPVRQMNAGAQLVFDETNAQGGVSGRRVQLVVRDDALVPERAVKNVGELLDQVQPLFFMGNVGSANLQACAPLLKQAGVCVLAPFAITDSVRTNLSGIAYSLRATTTREAEVLALQLTTIGIRRIAMACLDLPAAREVQSIVQAQMARHQIELVDTAWVHPNGDNAAECGKQLAAARVQAQLLYMGGILSADVIRAGQDNGAAPMWLGLSIVSGETTAQVLGRRSRGLIIAKVMPYPWDPVDALRIRFRQQVQAAGLTPSYELLEGYVAAQVALEVLRRCAGQLTRVRVAEVLRSFQWTFGGLHLDFTRDGHTASRHVELVQVTEKGGYLR